MTIIISYITIRCSRSRYKEIFESKIGITIDKPSQLNTKKATVRWLINFLTSYILLTLILTFKSYRALLLVISLLTYLIRSPYIKPLIIRFQIMLTPNIGHIE